MDSGGRSQTGLTDTLIFFPLLDHGLEDTLTVETVMYINDFLINQILVSPSLQLCSDVEKESPSNSAAAGWWCISNTRHGTQLSICCSDTVDSLPKSHFLLFFTRSTSVSLREQGARNMEGGRLVYDNHGDPLPFAGESIWR